MPSPKPSPVPSPKPVPSPAGPPAPPVLAEVVRSGFVEGRHRGSLVLLGADGAVQLALGDVTSPVFPRSANKPMQAAGVLRAGLELRGERLALAAASHAGEPFHRDLVRTLLAEHGLTAEQLRCPPDLPLDPVEREAYLAAGGVRDRVAMNCSGKHTAMLAACALRGWPLESYLDPGHPLQRLIHTVVEDAAGEPVATVGTDGCGAPLAAIGLTGLARAFRSFVRAEPGSAERRVADAMRAHPEYVAGSRRHDTWLMREVPGTLAKTGAEAVQAVALADGRALAFKVEDGGARSLGPVLARALALLGVASPVLDRVGRSPLTGGSREVGEVRAAF
ncbi:asparaginase [Streptomyces griseoviridis]|uniref:Asparaginase n=1 Tax=Streptomyces griseoviridis TaxID=45398 RepID=A0A3S9ZF83_STRGD|nr:asparaginase [Streptomyces griseoviridis]AZS86413.1 asparaginase [Streptomyces griseoviridis]QCN86723.1 asparaginase [Streptomyces griseoviridis]